MRFDDWFLTGAERGNPATEIDRHHGGVAWTEGNAADVLVDGREYFARLHEELESTRAGDSIRLTDLEGQADEHLVGPGTEIGRVLADAAARGVDVRGLLWRSHPKAAGYHEEENLLLARIVNEAGGEVLLDNRIRRRGSHHQKIVIVRHRDAPERDVAFVGGIDLAHGRHDSPAHAGDPQPAELDHQTYGERPPWHDVQIRVAGPAVDDVALTFRERWEDPAPVDSRGPFRRLVQRAAKHPPVASPLPDEPAAAPGAGPLAVQVLRTYPTRRRAYPFAPRGERSIARAYIKAFGRAEQLIYLEDQYLWSLHATRALSDALRRAPELRVVIVVPRYPDPDGWLVGAAARLGRARVIEALQGAAGDRVAVYDLENEQGVPIYVHSKVCVVDDTWMAVGSDNLNRRSWTHDSEVSCAVLDPTMRLARETRVRLAREHTGRDDDTGLIDPAEWFDTLRSAAGTLDAWHRDGGQGTRPPGHLRVHPTERMTRLQRWAFHPVHARVLDPDGRPWRLRREDAF